MIELDMIELVKNNVCGLVSDFVYYDRKEDEELDRDDIKKVFIEGIVSVDDVVSIFRQGMEDWLEMVKK